MYMQRKGQERDKVVTVADFATWTNQKSILTNAGSGGVQYQNYKQFSVKEIMMHIGLYIHNSLAPSPQVDFKFESAEANLVNESKFIKKIFSANAKLRHKEMKAFFACSNLAVPPHPIKEQPNFKLNALFRHAMPVSKETICLGKYLSGDEHIIGCQGRHPGILRINYKREGDGFQCDCICSNGYTYSFYFRNQNAPKRYTDKGISPLHSQVQSLFDQLPNKHYVVEFDNIYMSTTLCRTALTCDKKS